MVTEEDVGDLKANDKQEVKSENDSLQEPESSPKLEMDSEEKNKKIRDQIEYYFSDVNLMRDKFMQEELKTDNGWIALETMVKFNRLANITKSFNEITGALEESSFIEVSEDKTKIRRNPSHPIPDLNDEFRKSIIQRTAYVKNFPLDEKLDAILNAFKEYNVQNVIMRNYRDKKQKCYKFKGSCFVTFPSVAECEAFVNKDVVKYTNGESLLRKLQAVYMAEKKEELAQKKEKKNNMQKGADSNVNIKSNTNPEVTKNSDCDSSTLNDNKSDVKTFEYPKHSLLKFTIEGDESEDWDSEKQKSIALGIKNLLLAFKVPVAFVEVNKNADKDKVYAIRLKTENSSIEFLQRHGGKPFEYKNLKIVFSAFTDDEESEYYKKLNWTNTSKPKGVKRPLKENRYFKSKRVKKE